MRPIQRFAWGMSVGLALELFMGPVVGCAGNDTVPAGVLDASQSGDGTVDAVADRTAAPVADEGSSHEPAVADAPAASIDENAVDSPGEGDGSSLDALDVADGDAASDAAAGESDALADGDASVAAEDMDGHPAADVADAAEASPDAGPPGADATDDAAAGESTMSITLATQGEACLQCAAQSSDASASCLAQFACEGLGDPSSDAGPSRRGLCYRTLSCALGTSCAATSAVGCYCGSISPSACQNDASAAAGRCAAEERLGLETSDPMQIIVHYSDATLGGGMANDFVRCLKSHHCSCFNDQ